MVTAVSAAAAIQHGEQYGIPIIGHSAMILPLNVLVSDSNQSLARAMFRKGVTYTSIQSRALSHEASMNEDLMVHAGRSSADIKNAKEMLLGG